MRRTLKWTRGSTGGAEQDQHRVPWGRLAAAGVVVVALLPAMASGEDGNIAPNTIEVVDDANLYPYPVTGCDEVDEDNFNATPTPNPETDIDWVKDCGPRAGGTSQAEKTLTPGVDAAVNKGHWNGFRVLDGIAGDDLDIFLTGGKENDHETWNPGPGSVGSSKYDITQAYLANNSASAFFGMERRGNNGTTAFDWEFNKYAPDPEVNPDYIPNRSEGDVLLTFEMQGSGKTGSATPHRFVYDDPDVLGDPSDPADDSPADQADQADQADTDFNGTYVSVGIGSIESVINDVSIPSAPWGAVTSQGDWSTDDLDKFKFAEADVPLTLLGIDPANTCEDISRFVQVRTRASSTENSDLKDLTKIFNFEFFAPEEPDTTVTALCDAQFDFGTSLTADDGDAPDWTFSIDDVGGEATEVELVGTKVDPDDETEVPVALSEGTHDTEDETTRWEATAFSGRVQVNLPEGLDSVVIHVEQSTTSGSCDVSSTGSVTVYRGLSVAATSTPDCDGMLNWTTSVLGGEAPYDLSVKLQRLEGEGEDAVWTTKQTTTVADDADGALTTALPGDDLVPYDAGAAPGLYRVHVKVTDSQDPACVAEANTDPRQIAAPLSVTAAKGTLSTANVQNLSVPIEGTTAPVTGATFTYEWEKRVDSEAELGWETTGVTTEDFTYSNFETDETTPTSFGPFTVANGAASGVYQGRVWVVQLRLKVTRTVDGLVCTATSNVVTVKMVKMVDP